MGSDSKPKVNNSAECRARILDVAQGLFARFGFRKTLIGEIARGVRVSKATLYVHFPRGKEEVFAQVVRKESRVLLDELERSVDGARTYASKVRAFFTTRTSRMRQLANLHQVSEETLAELLPLAEEARQDFYQREVALLEGILVEGRRAGEFDVDKPKLVALALFSATKGLDIVFLRIRDSPELAEGLEEMLELLLRALKPSGLQRAWQSPPGGRES